MAGDGDRLDLAAASQCQVDARRLAAGAVIEKAGPIRRRLLRRLHSIIELFAGMRDTPKHHVLLILHGLRRRLVLEGEQLVRRGRLDAAEHVFDLTLEELHAADSDCELNLRDLRDQRRGFRDRLAMQVINFPAVIDSRGRILRPPRTTRRPGEFVGAGLSPGVATGTARTLRSPYEKPLATGEILIAYTTDPGWTPIFARAAAVVLEVGGTLQHGAVVARELGLPCVAGIEGITTAIKDGQLIEVDGYQGTVKVLQA
jgi:pyruvate,water dikinase